MKTLRVLPADVYDALELSALAYGGIGAAYFYDANERPLCARGHIYEAANEGAQKREVIAAFTEVSLTTSANDWAVQTINAARRRPLNARVPFDAWCKELNVVRGT